MGAKEFLTAIDMLDVYNKIVKQEKKTNPPVHLTTRELGRYRFYIYREKMLGKEIKRLCAEHARLERLMQQRGVPLDRSTQCIHKREKHNITDLFFQLAIVKEKKRNLEKKLDQIADPMVRRVVFHRYFKDTDRRLPTWAQTARELQLPLSGTQLRAEITAALQ